jgi:diadenosine tetraphosphate (Ap4A) HIT family hydrolase
MYDKNNIFAQVINGEIPFCKVTEGVHSIALNDRYPQARIHMVVIPKGEYENIIDFNQKASEAEKKDFWNTVDEAAGIAGVRGNFKLVSNTGEMAEQSVPHFHVHILSNVDSGLKVTYS